MLRLFRLLRAIGPRSTMHFSLSVEKNIVAAGLNSRNPNESQIWSALPNPNMNSLVKELKTVSQKIAATEADLAQAKAEGDRELITAYVKLLAGLQEEKNRLSQAAAADSGVGVGRDPAVLVKNLETCDSSQLGADGIQCPNPYGLEGFVADAVAVVQEYLPETVRTPPLMISSLARSGKTTALGALFMALKESEIAYPIIISFNGNSGFVKRSGESCCDSFLRMVAAQFVADPKGDFSCTEKALEAHLRDEKVVLLIDELNALCAPVDEELSLLIKRMFLDRPGRYLVFSTHYPLAIDVGESFIRSDSGRVCRQIQLPRCTDVNVLRKMAPQCSDLQPCRVALYAGMPSLIFLSCINTLSIQQRFERRRIEDSVFNNKLVQKAFVTELLDGFAMRRDFDVFSSVDAEGKHIFPVVYIECIIRCMDIPISDGVTEVVKQLEAYSNLADTGKDWECIVLLALLLRCFQARTKAYSLFDHIHLNPDLIDFVKLPSTCNTLALAKLKLSEQAGLLTSCVIIGYPTAANFPFYDAMLLVRERGRIDTDKYVGLQMKLGKAYPSAADGHAPEGWSSFWVRGDATGRSRTPRNGWIYLDRSMLIDFLGYSLKTLYPADW